MIQATPPEINFRHLKNRKHKSTKEQAKTTASNTDQKLEGTTIPSEVNIYDDPRPVVRDVASSGTSQLQTLYLNMRSSTSNAKSQMNLHLQRKARIPSPQSSRFIANRAKV